MKTWICASCGNVEYANAYPGSCDICRGYMETQEDRLISTDPPQRRGSETLPPTMSLKRWHTDSRSISGEERATVTICPAIAFPTLNRSRFRRRLNAAVAANGFCRTWTRSPGLKRFAAARRRQLEATVGNRSAPRMPASPTRGRKRSVCCAPMTRSKWRAPSAA